MTERANHLLLIGMMGSGKTTVGRELARRLSRPFFDSDEQVTKARGKSVPEIFKTEGEAAFRRAEREALEAACTSITPSVIAVAGGAVLDPANRQLCRSAGQVVWLRALEKTLARRVGNGSGRPLLEGDVAARLHRLDTERRAFYEELAEIVIDVEGHDIGSIVGELVDKVRAKVRVDLGSRSYDVLIGPGTRNSLGHVLPQGAQRAAIVTQAGVDIAIDCPIEHETFLVPDGEAAKSLSTVEELCRGFARFGLTRSDVIVGLGGGVVTDVAGFTAACYHRGIAVAHVSTTLLGQIDAAIGGKTGVNLPEGKNLVGAFHQPVGVLCDTDLLATLPEREWHSGCGEMAKYAFLGVDNLDRLPLVTQIARCVELKARVVAGDEREDGGRVVLNYGHTLGHALEAIGFHGERPDHYGVDLRHGEAVAIGLVFAARLAHLLGRIDAARVQRHIEVVQHYGLSPAIPTGVDLDELVVFMSRDKKVSSGLTFVLDGPDGVELVSGIDRETVLCALRESLGEGAHTDVGATRTVGSAAS